MLRPVALVLVLVLTTLAAAGPALAQEPRGGDGLSELWEEYPLQPTTTTEQDGSSPARTDARERTPPAEQGSTSSPLVIALLLLGVALVALGLAGGALRLVRGDSGSLSRH